MLKIQQWVRVGDYEIFVHDVVEEHIAPKLKWDQYESPEMVLPDGTYLTTLPDAEDGRVMYVNVEYRNSTRDNTLSCRRNQWYLFDAEGYNYEAESTYSRDFVHLYENQNKRYLGGERLLNPQTRLRGWLAFKIPKEAVIERIQFITGFLGGKAADFAVGTSRDAATATGE